MNVLLTIVERFPNVVPFLVYIKKEDFHRQRFAVRAKYMTTDPGQNKYISNFEAIRLVQSSLSAGASEHLIPKIDNRNIDRSLETMHQTLFSYLKKLEGRTSMFDPESKKLTFLDTIWKRRKQKQTSKSKTLKAINQLQTETEEPPPPADAPSTPFEEMMKILPSENAVFNDVVSENDISFNPSGTMLLRSDPVKDDQDETPPQTPIAPQPRVSAKITFLDSPKDGDGDSDKQRGNEFNDGEFTETEADPVELTLTDFAETTDFIETTDTDGPETSIFSSQTRLFFTPKPT